VPDWLGLVLAMVPIILAAAFGTRQVIYSKRARVLPEVPPGWVAVRGVVVDEQSFGRRRPAKDGTVHRVRRPVIAFRAADGREFTFTSRIRAAGTPGIGSLVDVYHHPVDPTLACIAPTSLPNVVPSLGLAEKWVIVNIWIMVAVVGLIIALVVLNA
jgi:hypothetical protein